MDVDKERFAWIRFTGVPCHSWGERTFSLIAETRGSYVKCDEESLLKTRMDEARVCIRTKWRDRVDDILKTMIEGVLFLARIMEDKSLFYVKNSIIRHREESDSELYS